MKGGKFIMKSGLANSTTRQGFLAWTL